MVTGAEHPLTATHRDALCFRSPSEVHSSTFRLLPFSLRQLSANQSSLITYSSSTVSDIELIIHHFPKFVNPFFLSHAPLPLVAWVCFVLLLLCRVLTAFRDAALALAFFQLCAAEFILLCTVLFSVMFIPPTDYPCRPHFVWLGGIGCRGTPLPPCAVSTRVR